MKIFNWVHRKFHQHNGDRYTVSPKQDHFPSTVDAKPEAVATETDTKALLQPEGDVWNNSILSIGTLGYEYSITDEEEEEEEYYSVTGGEEQLKQLAIVPYTPSLQKTASEKSDAGTTVSEISVVAEVEITPDTWPLLLPEIMTEKKRVTLADLLSQEKSAVETSAADKKKISVDSGKNEKISAGVERKSLLSFGKKQKKKDKGEERPPKRNLQRIIAKMLKKKIYPDIEGRFNGKYESKDTPTKSTDSVGVKNRSKAHTVEMTTLA